MKSHSKLPWVVTKLSHANDQLWLQITDANGRGPVMRINSPGEKMADNIVGESRFLITSEENQIANAELIVRTVNAQPAVVAFLEKYKIDHLIDNGRGGLKCAICLQDIDENGKGHIERGCYVKQAEILLRQLGGSDD